ncbi:MAG: hypothetical protein DYG85_10870 [Chloroflexi bacterium CFX1]|nr:hypothetical protein [Chloroflexi bacterium CFX1]
MRVARARLFVKYSWTVLSQTLTGLRDTLTGLRDWLMSAGDEWAGYDLTRPLCPSDISPKNQSTIFGGELNIEIFYVH